jgi:hypothetical protein
MVVHLLPRVATSTMMVSRQPTSYRQWRPRRTTRPPKSHHKRWRWATWEVVPYPPSSAQLGRLVDHWSWTLAHGSEVCLKLALSNIPWLACTEGRRGACHLHYMGTVCGNEVLIASIITQWSAYAKHKVGKVILNDKKYQACNIKIGMFGLQFYEVFNIILGCYMSN